MSAKFKLVGFGLALACFTPAISVAQDADPTSGRRIVQTECSRCHATTPGTQGTDPGAPNLVDVARMPSATDLSLRVFLHSPHRSMPDLVLSEEEITSIIAYVRSLAR